MLRSIFKGPNQKNLRHQKAQQVLNKLKGTWTYQKVWTKNLRHQKHNKCQKCQKASTFQRLKTKTLGPKRRNNKCPPRAKGLRRPEGTNQKHHRKNRKMDAKKGRDIFLFGFGIHRSSHAKQNTRKKKTRRDNGAQGRGRRFSPKHKTLRTLPRRWTIYLMKDQKRRGHFFSKKHNPNACHFGWQ